MSAPIVVNPADVVAVRRFLCRNVHIDIGMLSLPDTAMEAQATVLYRQQATDGLTVRECRQVIYAWYVIVQPALVDLQRILRRLRDMPPALTLAHQLVGGR